MYYIRDLHGQIYTVQYLLFDGNCIIYKYCKMYIDIVCTRNKIHFHRGIKNKPHLEDREMFIIFKLGPTYVHLAVGSSLKMTKKSLS